MGLIFTLISVLTALLSPQAVFGSLSQYHIEVIFAVIILVFSLFSAAGSGVSRMPQTYALIGLGIAVTMSMVVTGWMGGAEQGLLDYIPSAMMFFFVVWNCKTRTHLRLLVAVILFAALVIIVLGFFAVQNHDVTSPYALSMQNDSGEYFLRLRGLSFLNDPNDLAQFLVALIPMLFFFWGKGKYLTNFLFVYAPMSVLLFGMYLTHSRGGMVAIMVAAVVAGRRKIGVLPAMIGGGLVFAGMMAAGFAGGREVGGGGDRMEAWSTGLTLIKAHPIFGVGYKAFTEYFYITAHNTVVVCAAELGLVGLFFWMLFILPTVRDAVVASAAPEQKKDETADAALAGSERPGISGTETQVRPAYSERVRRSLGEARLALHPATASEPAEALAFASSVPAVAARGGFPGLGMSSETDEDPEASAADIRRLSSAMVVSFAGFLTASWFLSRPYTMVLYLNAGIAAVIFRMARERGMATAVPLRLSRAAWMAAVSCVILIALVYVTLRVDNLFKR